MNYRILIIMYLLIMSSKIGLAQEIQSDLINSANLKFIQMDDAISKGQINVVREMQKEIQLIADKIENIETRFLVYSISINKYYDSHLYKEAISLSSSSLNKAILYYGEKHKQVADFLFYLSFSYAHDRQIGKAIEYGEQSIQMYEALDAVHDETYIMAVLLLTDYYNENGQYPESISILKKSLAIIGTSNISLDNLSIVYRSLANNYINLNNYSLAQLYTLKAIEIYKDKQSLNYLSLKQNLAWLYDKNANQEDAIRVINDVCNTLKLKNDSLYAISLCDKASFYIHTRDENRIIEAIQYTNEAAKIFEAANDTLSNGYVDILMTEAEAYRSLNLYSKSQIIYERVYNLLKQLLDFSNIDDLIILANSAVLANSFQDGLSYFQKAQNLIIQKTGGDNANFVNLEWQISELYYLLKDYENAIINIWNAIPTIRSILAKSFFELDDKDRTGFWSKYNYFWEESIPRMCYSTSNPHYSGLMYDASLFSKGILLNTERLMRKLIQEGATVEEWLNPFFLDWQGVQSMLKDDDIAVEFVRVNLNESIPVYMAVSLRRDSEMPKLTKLFIEDELKEVSDTIYYQCKEIAELVWKPLQEELHGINNIYFSPSGALYNIGIEYLPGMENYNIHRLSSTRELATGEKLEQRKSAVLYGGLNYNTPADSTNTAKNLALLEETFKERANVRSIDVRGSKEYLKHTKVEVDRIGDELRNAGWVCLLDTAAMGTEESFKALSGRRIGCLHISTHGFYYTKEEADNARYQFMLFNDNMVSAEDKALTRSGLLLSGANHVLERETIPDNVEDGILTAKEIADVDLRGLDLVVLSACQTGLGDIAQGEGVFGLQRGFKKAGANSILMSLWKVDDEATQILMTQFYKNYVSGQTKRQSLLSAQKYLKEYKKGKYKEPKYWAAFILLDAKE